MKSAMASLEIYAFPMASGTDAGPLGGRPRPGDRPRRLSLVIGAPERAPGGDAWHCRIVLADHHRPDVLEGRDSMEALLRAVDRAHAWLAALRADGMRLCRDRAGLEPLERP
ncbi:MAG: hypothetical protein R3F35_11485 [Myxococcota bacterium]